MNGFLFVAKPPYAMHVAMPIWERTNRVLRLVRMHASLAVAISSLAVLVGCGRADGPELATVEGVVELDGAPLAGARVEFNPVASRGLAKPSSEKPKKGESSVSGSFAITDEDGNFVLQYGPGRTGAVLGEHTVKITTLNVNLDDPKAWREKVPRFYNTGSELKYTVTAGENIADFDLKSTLNAKR